MERDSHRARVSENARGRQMDLMCKKSVLEGKEEDTLKTRARVMKNNCQGTETCRKYRKNEQKPSGG